MAAATTAVWVARGRALAGYLVVALAALTLIGAVTAMVAIVRFQLGGHVSADFERDQLDWADLFSGLVFTAIFVPACLWIALLLLPDSSALIRWVTADPAPTTQDEPPAVRTDAPGPDAGPPAVGSSEAEQRVRTHRHTRASAAREAAVQRELAERRREEEVRTLMRSNPDVGTAVMWMDRLLREQAEANHRAVAEAGRQDKRRDLMFFAFGTCLGIAQPVIGPPILGLVWH